jgi:hypothetical protein
LVAVADWQLVPGYAAQVSAELHPGKQVLKPAAVFMHQFKPPAELRPQSRLWLHVCVHQVPLHLPSPQSESESQGSPISPGAAQAEAGPQALLPLSSSAQQPLLHSESLVQESAHMLPVE